MYERPCLVSVPYIRRDYQSNGIVWDDVVILFRNKDVERSPPLIFKDTVRTYIRYWLSWCFVLPGAFTNQNWRQKWRKMILEMIQSYAKMTVWIRTLRRTEATRKMGKWHFIPSCSWRSSYGNERKFVQRRCLCTACSKSCRNWFYFATTTLMLLRLRSPVVSFASTFVGVEN